ncbi:MAG: hypothetical protein Q8L10_02080 [Candidatus Moranbacteria bacterium]|nr:hypothetical protein [Candidatus Moranbacteria bacterium]
MWFDLTEDVTLAEKDRARYKKFQTALYALAFLAAAIMAVRVVFDAQNFTFSFTNPDSAKNSITIPRYQDADFPVENGRISAGRDVYFDMAATGTFSTAVIEFPQDKDSSEPNSGSIIVKKSYQAFLYPEGEPIGFKDGSILKNNGGYYLVSQGALRRFDTDAVAALGYAPEAFVEAAPEELRFNPAGEPIRSSEGYPDDSIFKINGEYYLLEDARLKKFSSEQAFLSQYGPQQALEKNTDIFSRYPLSETLVGFSDGSLISYGESVYIVSDNKILPVNNPVTFLEKGFAWEDVIAASADEIALYEKTKLFNIKSVHPDGTVFANIENAKHYMVKDSKKHFLPSQNVADSWLRHSPIPVSEKSLEAASQCAIKQSFFGSYSCEIPIASLQQLAGTNYEFIMKLDNGTKIDYLNVSFKKDISRTNLVAFVRDIYNKIKNRYAPQVVPAP